MRLNSTRINKDGEKEPLTGILPKHLFAKSLFTKLIGQDVIQFLLLIASIIPYFVEQLHTVKEQPFYLYVNITFGGLVLLLTLLAVGVKLLFLPKFPQDDWVLYIASKRLNGNLIFYDRHYLYFEYDRAIKENEKRELVSELTDKSDHYSYYFIDSFVDIGFIKVESKPKSVVPNIQPFNESDDILWNAVPLGLQVNNDTQKISPLAWYINDNNRSDHFLNCPLSNSIIIAGQPGCFAKNTPVPMYAEKDFLETGVIEV